MASKTIEVVKAFRLMTEGFHPRQFAPGTYEVDEDVADHWYVKAHSKGGSEDPNATGEEQVVPPQAELPLDPPADPAAEDSAKKGKK